MSANGDDQFTVEEAAEKLRAIRSSAGEDALREFLQTGGGLLSFEENDLIAAIDVVGRQRAQQILGVDVPSEAPGEQAALGGGRPFPDQPTERAEPVPEGSASLSDFGADDDDNGNGFDPSEPITRDNFPLEAGDEFTLEQGQRAVFIDYPTGGPEFRLPDEPAGFDTAQLTTEEFRDLWRERQEGTRDTLDCRSFQAQVDRVLATAKRRIEFRFDDFAQAVNEAERRGCISAADASRLRDTAQNVTESDPEPRLIDQLQDDSQRAFAAGGPGNR